MVLEADLVKALNLKTVVASADGKLNIEVSNVNRPGLQLAGYWDFFGFERPQLLGHGGDDLSLHARRGHAPRAADEVFQL